MELLAVRNARFIAEISIEEVNPRGLAVYQSLVDGLVDKYNFSIPPNEDEPFDEVKGIAFGDGVWSDIVIDKLTIFNTGIVIDTRSSTQDSEAIFNEAMQWASESLGLTYRPEMIARKVYVSEFILRSKTALNSLNPALQAFCEKLFRAVSVSVGLTANYELNGIAFNYDSSQTKVSIAPFKIERLENTAYSENKYYSLAPLPTDEHLQLLEELESILSTPSA